jgi:hypothetical protein
MVAGDSADGYEVLVRTQLTHEERTQRRTRDSVGDLVTDPGPTRSRVAPRATQVVSFV